MVYPVSWQNIFVILFITYIIDKITVNKIEFWEYNGAG